MSFDPDTFVLHLYDQGVSIPATHAAAHAAGGSDPITIANTQVTGLGTMSTQGAGAVAITGGSIAGVTIVSGNTTITGGTIGGVVLGSANATLTGGSINGMVIGGTTPAAGTFTNLTVTGTLTIPGTMSFTSITLTTPLPVASGGTGATSAANARTNLGIGTLGTQTASAVTISGGTISGVTTCGTYGTTTLAGSILGLTGTATIGGNVSCNGAGSFTLGLSAASLSLTNALPIASGGTGANNVTNARLNLGLIPGLSIQVYSPDLTAIAALTSAADKMPYATGASAWALTNLTSFGRSIAGAVDAAAARTLLDVDQAGTVAMAKHLVTLSAGTTGTVVDTNITNDSIVYPMPVFGSGSNEGHLSVAISAGASFTVMSTNGADNRQVHCLVVY